MKMEVTKEFTFDAAHMLTAHQGLCKNLHGHTYRVQVTVGLDQPRDGVCADGMVVDFKALKDAINTELFDLLDHSYVYNSNGGAAERQIAELLNSLGMKTFELVNATTAENMARYFFTLIDTSILPTVDSYLRMRSITVWETATSYATYHA